MLTLTFRLSPRPNPGAIGELAPKESFHSAAPPALRTPLPQRCRRGLVQSVTRRNISRLNSARQSSLILYSPVRRRATPQSAVHLSVRSARHCSKEASGTLSQSGAVVG